MEIDQSEEDNARKSDALRNLSTKGPLPTSMAKLSGSSRIIPSQKDFYFYNNFQEFKKPVQEIDEKSKNLLKEVGASENLFGKAIPLPDDKDVELDDDVALDWLVNVNDEIFERIDVSLDEFKRSRNKEEESGVRMMKVDDDDEENGFQMEKLSVLDFVDRPDSAVEPVKPLPIEVTPFKLVEDLKGLKQLAIKLRNVDEFAVDLEHNQYRSFQGLTCLMQISTRTEDFIIDTLRLRVQIGPHLREVFKDPTKRKVLHGADRDIVWLQRDFGIYVCNMFDTGQPMTEVWLKALGLEGIENGKAQHRIPVESFLWSRGKQRRLCHLFDPKLSMVYKRSYDICAQLYEKELLTDTSYLYIYGLQCAELNAQQLAVVSQLIMASRDCELRDAVARAEDESTGYVLPNRTLIEIAKQMPLTTNQLRRVLKSKHPYIDRNLGSVVSIIRHSIQNAAAFEGCKAS
ncbi:protein RRP6-like 2 [Sesamum angolense]|uniref:Protein RRP6-like 2 n=1 Tax=Sesamum angolense TaxID=2727404 RepID=A0AAE1T5A4_9LAMI|nr:protein RRP6-like 2 [Sesamum angolense]